MPEAALDRSVRRVLALKEALGLFRDPYARMDPQREAATLLAPAHRAAALALAEKSLVLVKNERSTLPFTSDVRRVAVIGPRADARADMMGPWSADGHPADAVTLADGLRELLPQARGRHRCRPGARARPRRPTSREAVAAAKAADVVVLALGEKAVQSGEAASRADPSLPVDQLALAQAVLAAGRPTAVVLFHGRPLVLGPLVDQADAAAAGLVSRDHGRCRHCPDPVRRERAARPAADLLAALGRARSRSTTIICRPAGRRPSRPALTPPAIWTSRPARCFRSGSG